MIDPKEIHDMILDCLFKEGEPTDKFVAASGVVGNFGFHPDRLASYKPKLAEMIGDLHPAFLKEVGGGWTFLNLCMDKNEHTWTDSQRVADEFLCLCVGNNLAQILIPRDMWSMLPGVVPYVVFSKEGFE